MEHTFYAPINGVSTNKSIAPNLTVTSHMERSSAISIRFGRFKTRLGYGQNQVFHSFKHTAMTMFEQADVPENIAMDIVGHEKPNITFGHYRVRSPHWSKRSIILPA